MIIGRPQRRHGVIGVARSTGTSPPRLALCLPLLVVAIAGLLSIAEVTSTAAPSTNQPALASTGLIVASFLALLAMAAWATVASQRSRWWHVFSARRVSASGLGLLAGAGVLTASLARRNAFQHVTVKLEIAASDVADIGIVCAIVICLVMAVAAMFEAWDARREERYWSHSLLSG